MKSILSEILELAESGQCGVLVTVIAKEGSGPAATGTKMIVYPDASISGTVGGGSIEKMAIKKALELMKTKENATEQYSMDEPGEGIKTGMMCGGSATLFFEYFAAKKHVYIYGGGHIGSALCYHLTPLNYHVTVIDDRKEILEKFDKSVDTFCVPFKDALQQIKPGRQAFHIIATYQHKYDGLVLNSIYQADIEPEYVGMVSSRKKKEQLTAELLEKVPNADLGNYYMPVGLNIGGTLPHEIAISIISEMQAVANGKTVKHLRDGHD